MGPFFRQFSLQVAKMAEARSLNSTWVFYLGVRDLDSWINACCLARNAGGNLAREQGSGTCRGADGTLGHRSMLPLLYIRGTWKMD